MRATDLRDLQLAFHDHAGWYRNARGKRACWLWQFDDRHHPCSGRLEAIHLLGRQRVRNRLYGLEPELVAQAEWDSRNAALGCTHHHRRFDSHATPPLRVPVYALRREALDFVTDWGLESDAEAKFTGSLDLALGIPGSSDPAAMVLPARVQSGLIAAGQPSAW